MTTMTGMYLAYVVLTVGITIWVARTLRTHGRVFLTYGQEDQGELNDALSHLLVIGFYLVNFGVISFALKATTQASDISSAIELLSTKVGVILLVIGGMHFFLLAMFASIRSTNLKQANETHRRDHIAQLAVARRTNITDFEEPQR